MPAKLAESSRFIDSSLSCRGNDVVLHSCCGCFLHSPCP